MTEAFAAGWRAKKHMADKKQKRGFEPTSSRGPPTKPGQQQSPQQQDSRKLKSRCAGCGQLGHWKGDPGCPKVKSGENPPFVPKAKSGMRIQTAHWVGMVAVLPKEGEDKESDSENQICFAESNN